MNSALLDEFVFFWLLLFALGKINDLFFCGPLSEDTHTDGIELIFSNAILLVNWGWGLHVRALPAKVHIASAWISQVSGKK